MARKDPMFRSKVWMPRQPDPPTAGDYVVCAILVAMLVLMIIGLWSMAFSDPPKLSFDDDKPAKTQTKLLSTN